MPRRDPLAPRWLGCDVPPQRAGVVSTARLRVENAGAATWRSTDDGGLRLAYHWLDPRGNPIVWDGERTVLARPVRPDEAVEVELRLTAPRPPGRYRLAVDLVEEHRFWLAEIGCAPLELDVEVAPRIAARRLGVRIHGGDDPRTRAALATQEEPLAEVGAEVEAIAHLVAGAEPEPGWSARLLDGHAEGYVAVG
ncbi:MAG: hypothetical protein FJW96_15100, partial [Actinobacteria bacterium]|nr:hypothetical protein [Actinomycetota bacterium]